MTDQEYIDVATGYFRDAFIELGKHCVDSNEKHNGKDAPIKWTRDIANDHWGSWGRHISKLGKIDEDSGKLHDVAWLWRTCAISQIRAEEDNLDLT